MPAKKKKQVSSQTAHKSSNGSSYHVKSTGRIKFKSKHKEHSGKIDSSISVLEPVRKYGYGYASLVLILGMQFIIFFVNLDYIFERRQKSSLFLLLKLWT